MGKKSAIVLAVAFLLLLGSCIWEKALAQEERVRALYTTGLTLYNSGDYKPALKKFRKAIELAEGIKFTPFERSQGLLGLAETLRSLGQYKEAEQTFFDAASWAEKSGRKKNHSLSMIYNDLGALYFGNSQYLKAEEYWQKSEKISGKLTYIPVNNLTRLYITWGKSDKADEYLAKSKKLSKKRHQKHYSTAFYYYCLAMNQQRLGNYKEAEASFKKSLASAEKVIGASHFSTTKILSGQASLYRAQSKFDSSEKVLRKVLKTRLEIFDKENPFVAQTMYSLANVLADQGKYKEAHQYAQNSIDVLAKFFEGKDSLLTVKAKQALGNIKRQEGKYQDAQALLTESLKIETKMFGESHLDVAHLKRDLAKVMFDQSQLEQSESLLKDSISIINAQTGPDHPERIESARALGSLYLAKANFEKAKAQYLLAFELSKRVLGENSKATADSARDLGELFKKQKDFQQASQYLLTAKTIDTNLYGESSPQVGADSIALASIYDELGQTEKATALLAQASKIKQKIGDLNHQLLLRLKFR